MHTYQIICTNLGVMKFNRGTEKSPSSTIEIILNNNVHVFFIDSVTINVFLNINLLQLIILNTNYK